MKTAVVTGGSGFVGYHFLKELLAQDIMVYAMIRPNSRHTERLANLKNVHIIELDLADISKLPEYIDTICDVFYHLGWECSQRDFIAQNLNIRYTLQALEAAHRLGCKRFIGVGSQAEYGIYHGLITEDVNPQPVTAYGAAKLAACHLSRYRASELNIEWIWARLFSVYGPYDSENTLISYLIKSFKSGAMPKLTQAMHPWDYLYVTDAARALYALGGAMQNEGVYNIANGDIHPLRYFVERARDIIAPECSVEYGEHSKTIVPLNVSVEKIQRDTQWNAAVSFEAGICAIIAANRKNNRIG